MWGKGGEQRPGKGEEAEKWRTEKTERERLARNMLGSGGRREERWGSTGDWSTSSPLTLLCAVRPYLVAAQEVMAVGDEASYC